MFVHACEFDSEFTRSTCADRLGLFLWAVLDVPEQAEVGVILQDARRVMDGRGHGSFSLMSLLSVIVVYIWHTLVL